MTLITEAAIHLNRSWSAAHRVAGSHEVGPLPWAYISHSKHSTQQYQSAIPVLVMRSEIQAQEESKTAGSRRV